MISAREERAWRWAEGLLRGAAPDTVSNPLLEKVVKETGYAVPYDVILRWKHLGWVAVKEGDGHVEQRRYTLGPSAPAGR